MKALPCVVVAAIALLLPGAAGAAWSAASQVKGFSNASGVVASIDDGGTQQLGLLATTAPEGQGLYSLTRAVGATDWVSKKVFGPINNGRFAFARNGAAVVAWEGAQESGKQTVWAAYRPAGKAWGAPAKLDASVKIGKGPFAVISAKGKAAVIWSRKTAAEKREPDQIVYSATSVESWPPAPAELAKIDLAQPVDTDFNACLPGSDVIAGILPDGTPIAAWNDPYGSFKQQVTDLVPPNESGDDELGVCVVRVATPGSTPNVTGRPAIGWDATPAGPLPFWTPVGFEVDPDTGRTALVVRGNDDAVTADNAVCDQPGIQETDYCFDNPAFETRVSLGTAATVPHPGTTIAASSRISLRNGFIAIATRSGSAPLAAGIGTTAFPTLATLTPNVALTNGAIAVGPKGEAQLTLHNEAGFLKTFGAAAGSQFSPGNDIETSQATPSLTIGCNGDALVAWNRGVNGVFAAFNPSGAAQCDGSGGGGEEPNPPSNPGSGGGSGGGSAGAGAGGGAPGTLPIGTGPAPPAKKPLKCKKGFQKKTVHGKAKCTKKKVRKGKKQR